jgi:hypothetical protein
LVMCSVLAPSLTKLVICARPMPYTLSYLSYRAFTKLWRHAGLSRIFPYLRRSERTRPLDSLRSRQKRREKADDTETPLGINFDKYEYAIERTILEAPQLSLSYYVDVAGTVPYEPVVRPTDDIDFGNGGVSPEWGIDLVIHGGFVRYGPWADRQRFVTSHS